MSVSDYINSNSYLEVVDLIKKELKNVNNLSGRVIKNLFNKTTEFDQALITLAQYGKAEEFMKLFFHVVGCLYEFSDNSYEQVAWREYASNECYKYSKYIFKELNTFFDVGKNNLAYDVDNIIHVSLYFFLKDFSREEIASKGNLFLEMYEYLENNAKNKNQNFTSYKYQKSIVKIYCGDEDEIEYAICNLNVMYCRAAYLAYLHINKKYDELRKLFIYLKDEYNFSLNFDEIYYFINAFYANKQYRICENIIIKYCYNAYNEFESNAIPFFNKIMKELPNLDFNRIFMAIGINASERRLFIVLKILKGLNKNIEMLYEGVNNNLEFDTLKMVKINDNYDEIVNTYLLYQIAYKMLFRSYSYSEPFNEIKKIVVEISKRSYAQIFLKMLRNQINNKMYGKVAKTYIEMINTYLSKDENYNLYKDFVLEFDHIYERTKQNYYIYCYSLFNNDDVVYRSEYFNKNSKPLCDYCNYDNNRGVCHHFDLNKFELLLNTKEAFDDYVKFVDNMKKIKEEREFKIQSRKIISDFVKSLKKEEVFLNNEEVHLTPIVEIEESDYDSQIAKLSLKVGTNKTYVIKNLTDFINHVNNNEVFQYGKGLSINHNINNFDYESKMIIDYLQSVMKNQNAYEHHITRYIDATPSIIDRIFNEYTLQPVIIKKDGQDISCFYKNNSVKLEVEIKDNVLKLKDSNINHIIYGSDFDYIVKNNEIFRIEATNELRKMIRFCILNPEFELKYVKKAFLEQVYTRVGTDLTIDDDFRQNIKEYDLHIETYFSYVDDTISCLSKYFINDNEISLKEIDNSKNYKLMKYQNMIDSLGFVDNVIIDSQNVMLFLSANLGELKKLSDIYLSEEIKRIQIVKFNKPKPYLGYDTNMLSICLKNFSYSNEELYKILQAIKKKQRFVKLNKDVIIDIDKENANLLLQSVNDFSLDEKKLSEPQQVPLYYSLELLNQSEKYAEYEMDDFLRKILNDIASYKTSKFEVPESLREIMRDYQTEGFKWMRILCEYNFSGILADDMGLGKTIQIISLIMDSNVSSPSLIVCPKSIAYNWKAEFEKWNKDQEVIIIYGTPQERQNILLNVSNKKKVVYITSYDSLKNDLDLYRKLRFEFIILDEAQYIKNHTTLKAQSVKKLSGNHKFVLTGTPIENSIVDLWSIFDFLMPNYLYNYTKFKSIYETEIVQNKNSEVKEQLVKKITPFILRRTKNEVLKDLPEKIETIQYVTMSDEIKKYYEAELLKLRDIVDDPSSKIQVLASFTRLRQLCVDPSLYIDSYHEVSPKLELTMNLVNDLVNSNHKVIIFSQFTSVFDKLEMMLKEANIDYFTLTGKTKANSRVEMADIFNDETSKEKVFLVSLKAGGTGLNLTGADIVIHLDPWWNVAAEDQATGRAHRIGQKNVVNVIKIVCLDSIEQKVIELQNIKKEIITDIIADNDENIQKLSSDDLKILLS